MDIVNDQQIIDELIIDQPKTLTRKQAMVIINQQSKSLCQIITENSKATGFLCKIPNPVLITSNQILNEEQTKPGKEIKILFTDEYDKKNYIIIKIDDTRTVYTIKNINEEEINITIIELRPIEDNLKELIFMDIDEKLMNDNIEKEYIKKDVYLIHYKNDEDAASSTGIIKKIKKNVNSYSLIHTCEIDQYSSGGPIILYNHKIIGVHIGKNLNENFNKGTLLQYPIKEFCKKLDNKNKLLLLLEKNKLLLLEKNNILSINDNSKDKNDEDNNDEDNNKNENEDENIKNHNDVKISDENNKIIMVYKNSNEDCIKIFGEEFVKNNEENCKMYINKKLYKICEYIEYNKYDINQNDNFLTITLTEIKKDELTDLSFMFFGCYLLLSIDFNSFDTENVTLMNYMFYDCTSLTSLNLFRFNTKKVTNMQSMFARCFKLKTLNIKSFNTEQVINMGNMFEGCSDLRALDLKSFNTKNVTNMSWMFYNCCSILLLNLAFFNTENVTDMRLMFYCCSNLKKLNLESFNAKKANTFDMFYGCEKLSNCNSSDKNIENAFNCK